MSRRASSAPAAAGGKTSTRKRAGKTTGAAVPARIQQGPVDRSQLAKAAADWRKNGANASDESFRVLARNRAAQKAPAGQHGTWGQAVAKRSSTALDRARARRSHSSPDSAESSRQRAGELAAKAQKRYQKARAASLRADKAGNTELGPKLDTGSTSSAASSKTPRSKIEHLRALDRLYDKKFQALKNRPVSDPERTAAYNASVEASRKLYRAENGKALGSAGRGTAERARAAEILKQVRAKHPRKPTPKPEPVRDPSTHTDHAPGHVGELNADLMHVDPERFQYKLSPGVQGMTGSLSGVRKWNTNLGGVIQVWKDPANGKVFVVNGHNRAHLAKQLGVDKLTVRFINAKNAKEARAIGALTNIAEGRGDAIDAAKYFRDSGISRHDLEEQGVPMREKIATDGLALSHLEEGLFDRVVKGSIPHERATIIGGSGLTHDQQKNLVELVDKRAKKNAITNNVLRELTDTVRSSSSTTKKTHDLFGDDEETVSLGLHKASVQAYVKQRLSREKRLFGTVAKSRAASELERGGNKIDVQKSDEISKEAAQALDVFDRLKNLRGPIADHLNHAAERIHNGENSEKARQKVHNETYKRILANMAEALKF